MKRETNIQDLLKVIALIAMLIDHLDFYYFTEHNLILRAIGRIAMPIFCFFAGYNYNGKIKYSYFFHASLLQIALYYGSSYHVLNILFMILVGKFYIKYTQKFQKYYLLHIIYLSYLSIFSLKFFDYGLMPIAIMLLGFLAKNNNKQIYFILANMLGIIMSSIYFKFNTSEWVVTLLLFSLIIIIYNFNNTTRNYSFLQTISSRSALIYCYGTIIIIFLKNIIFYL